MSASRPVLMMENIAFFELVDGSKRDGFLTKKIYNSQSFIIHNAQSFTIHNSQFSIHN
ncbi:hypothetical protein HMPREF1870_01283 [Bacteroidales bacterium KA00344]|nr:hypothetical protein HMPREF1870_01283 [Bacteroidales bacterium KA00344]